MEKENPRTSWVVGDLVDVYVRDQWRNGKVIRVTGTEFFHIDLLDECRQTCATKDSLRPKKGCEGPPQTSCGSAKIDNHHAKTCKLEVTDAMSSCGPIKKTKTRREKKLKDPYLQGRQKYIATMREFRARGFITWEEKVSLCDDRLLYNISFEEHMSILKALGPSGTFQN